jgi:hypothetical protein
MAAIATLTVRLNAQIAEFQSEFRQATKDAQKFADGFEGVATRAAAVGTFFGNIATDIAKSLAAGLANALRDAVKFSSEFNNAFIGLGSVARAFGTDTDSATAAARRLSADGLLPLKDSATGLKNLLAAGFNLEQSTQLMNAFKDSAAFGRQGALSFGDAIRSATEGVKNGNSILVDNAGVTKNLSQILKEAGFSAQDLSRASSDVGVRMALFNGILKETAAQTGDAERLTQTYTGQVTRLGSQYQQLLASLGDSITQNKSVAIAIGFVGDAVQKVTKWLGENSNGYNLVTDAVILAAKTFGAFTTAIDVIHGALNTMDTALRTTVKSMADSTLELSNLLLKIATLASKLPGGSAAIGIYASEIASLAIISGEARATSKLMGDQIAANNASTTTWSRNLGTARASINDLVVQIENARGQTVKFGGAVRENTGAQIQNNDANRAAVALSSEQTHVMDLLAKAREHHRARLDFEAQSWKAWESTVSTALKNVAKNSAPLLLIGRDLSGMVPQIDAGGAGNLAGAGPAKGPGLLEKMFGTKADISNYFKSSFGNLSQDLSAAITGGGSVAKAFGNYATTVAKDFAASALAMIPGIGPILSQFASPIIDGLKKAFGSIFGIGTAGRDVVKEFAASFGGFDALQAKLLELGPEYDKLWRGLTQGVGRNNPQQAQAAIDAITAALERQKVKTAEVAEATTASAARQKAALDDIEASYNATIDGLKGELDSFSASLQAEADAPEFDEMGNRIYGVVEAQQMARKAQLEGEMAALAKEREAALNEKQKEFEGMLAAGTDVDAALREMFGKPLKIPYYFDPLNAPAGYAPPTNRTPALTPNETRPSSAQSVSARARSAMPNLDVTLKLPNGQVLLKQFVRGMESEGLA